MNDGTFAVEVIRCSVLGFVSFYVCSFKMVRRRTRQVFVTQGKQTPLI